MFFRLNRTLVIGMAAAALLSAAAGVAPCAAANLIQNGGFDSPGTAAAARAQADAYHETVLVGGANDGLNQGDMPYWTLSGTYTASGVSGSGVGAFVYTGPVGSHQNGLPNNLPQSGNYALYLRPTYSDVIQQSFAVTPGYTYSVSFYIGQSAPIVTSGNNINGVGTQSLDVSLIPDAGALSGSTAGSIQAWTLSGSSTLSGTVLAPISAIAPTTQSWLKYYCTFVPSATTSRVTLQFTPPPAWTPLGRGWTRSTSSRSPPPSRPGWCCWRPGWRGCSATQRGNGREHYCAASERQ